MTTMCPQPIAWERLVDYWAGDLDEDDVDRIDEHLFACDACTVESARVARIARAFRAEIPVVITSAQTAELRAQGLVVEERHFEPSTRTEVEFERGVDVLIHHLSGLDLSRADRVQVEVRVESTGAVLFAEHFAPFDRDRGEVLIACQRHFADLPRDVAFDVRIHEQSGRTIEATYLVPHLFPDGPGAPRG